MSSHTYHDDALTPPTQHETTPMTSSVSVTRQVIKFAREAIRDFKLIEDGDRVAVGMSGGKDSALLYATLKHLQGAHDMPTYSLHPIHLDQHQPGFDRQRFHEQLQRLGCDLEVVSQDTYSVVQQQLKPGQIPCALCGRMRRGILNQHCHEQRYNKLALGHHLDDALETFFLNLLYGRRLEPLKAATPASQHDVTTIRPLILIEERKILGWAVQEDLPLVACPVCDTFPESKRRDLKGLIANLAHLDADVHASVRAALYSTPETNAQVETHNLTNP